MVVGVLALQGDVAEHMAALSRLGVAAQEVRTVAELTLVRALIIPGGESTVMMKLLRDCGLDQEIVAKARAGMPIFGTCAGAILLSRSYLGLMDMEIDRNAYGSQLKSFSDTVEVSGKGKLVAEFIRAPKITEVGSAVTVLARYKNAPVLVRQDALLAATFHTETTHDDAVHQLFLEMVHQESGVES